MIRMANVEDVDNNLLNLYEEGYNMHYEERKDIFVFKTREELKGVLMELLDNMIESFLILEEKGKIIGYACFQYKIRATKSLWIDEIIIDSNYRGKGYGKALLEEIRKLAEENGCMRIELNCWSFNKSALKFYESAGYSFQRVVLEKEL